MPKKLLIFGASGHAKDVLETAKQLGYSEFRFVTTDGSCGVSNFSSTKEAEFEPSSFADWHCIAAIGNNADRKRLQEQYAGLQFTNIISPTAVVSESAQLGPGTYIGAFTYLGPDSEISNGVIINAHTVVGHDVKIEAYSHICPRVCISGHVEVGESVFIGAGALLKNGTPDKPLTISNQVHIGMGSTITNSLKTPGARIVPRPNYMTIRPE